MRLSQEYARSIILTSIGIGLTWLVGLVTTQPRLTTIDRTSGVGIMGGALAPLFYGLRYLFVLVIDIKI